MRRRRLPKRGHCEYRYCQCKKHLRLKSTEKCKNCNHGSCWHKIIKQTRTNDEKQFYSIREFANKPSYTNVNLYLSPQNNINIFTGDYTYSKNDSIDLEIQRLKKMEEERHIENLVTPQKPTKTRRTHIFLPINYFYSPPIY